MREFEFLQPKSIDEAIAMRVEHGERLVVFNGGTDIVIQLRDRLIAPDYVMDIKKIPGLRDITFTEKDGLHIGACATMNEIGTNEAVKAHYPYLAEAALSVGSKQVRNRATSVGNIVNASPLADTATPLYCYDAVVEIAGPGGRRQVPIRDFIRFVRKVDLQDGELVTGIRVPVQKAEGRFYKIARRSQVDLSTVCGTVLKTPEGWRIAMGSVAPTPLRLDKTEALLAGRALDEALINEAAALAATEVSPIDDVRADRQYRLDMVSYIVRDALGKLA